MARLIIFNKLFLMLFVIVRGQNDVKSSLTFVIDDTGSMWDDIDQVIRNVKLVFNTVVNSNATQIENFVLVTFNDPEVEILAVTKDEKVFKRALERIDVDGGGDCPEYVMTGIEKALEKSLPGSYFYVFTDASAKDYTKRERVQSLALRKQTQIVFLLTGKCHDDSYIGQQQYQAYYTLAKATSGRVFHMAKNEVGEVLNYISNTVENRKTEIASATFPPGDHTLNFTVDSGIKDTTVVVSGKKPKAKVHDSDDKETFSETLVNITGGIILKVPKPSPGVYKVSVGSESETSVSVTAETTVNFRHGFSILEPSSLISTTAKPIAGEKSYLSIQLITSGDMDIELRSIEIVDIEDNVITEAAVKVIDKEKSFYATEPLVSPNNLFKIVINAFDRKSNTTIRRYSLTPIEPQKPDLEPVKNIFPQIEILEGLKILMNYRDALKLTCKVTAYPKPKIVWMDVNSKTIMSSKDATIEYPDKYISVLEIEEMDKNTTYQCTASNVLGTKDSGFVKVEIKYCLNIIETPKNTSIQYKKQGSVKCKVDAFPPATVTWYFNGSEITAIDNVQITADGLTINSMELNLIGKYMCEIRNDFNKSVTHFQITASGLEAPAINKNIVVITALKGSDTNIICSIVRGKPEPTISWFFEPTDSPGFVSASSAHGDQLYLENLTPEQSGTYKCVARNIVGKDTHFVDLSVEYKPTIKPDVKTWKAREGSKPLIKCVVDAVPSAHVRWFLNDTLIVPSSDRRMYRDHSLRFEASLENSGVFRCVAENIHGKATKEISVDYFVPVKIEIPLESTIEANVNSSLVLPCHADGYPKPTVRWTFYSSDPKELPRILRTAFSQELPLNNIQLKEDGYYTCTAKNIGKTANITYRLIVNAPPVIVNAIINQENHAVVGDLVLRVPCEATGNPKPEIFWSYHNLSIAAGTEWYDIEDDGTLIIKNIDMKSRGYFKCRAENKLGSDEKHFLVDVSSAPYEEKSKIILHVLENKTVDVKCGATHNNVDRVRWFKNNKEIAENELRLERVTPLDSGVYTCRVSNFSLSVSASTEVIVEYAPKFESEVDLDIGFAEGTYAELDCFNYGEPEPTTQWFYEGKKLAANDMMHAFVMEYSNIGQYVCVVSNKFGSIDRTFSVNPPGCQLDISEDFRGNQPLIIPTRHIILTTIGQHLQFPRYESVKLVCPERFNKFYKSEIIATCEQNSEFRVEGNVYRFQELSCTSLMVPQVNRTGFRCTKDDSETVNIGFSTNAGKNFLTVYEICMDKHKQIPIFTKHTLHRPIAGIDLKDGVWQASDLVPLDFQKLYNCDMQNAYITSLLGQSFHEYDKCCFGKRQLVSSKDVMPGLPQAATYNYLNVIPQWGTCNTRNWDDLEQRIRMLAKSANKDLLVWTGHAAHKPLKLHTKTMEDRIVNLNPQMVSTYLWKVILDTTSRSSLAIIQVNVPDLKASDKNKYTLCTDICDKIEWMEDRLWDNVSDGYTYCCEIRDFEKAFRYKNAFSPSGDKILQYVSLIASPGLTT